MKDSKAEVIKVVDQFNTKKNHTFRFYPDGHVTYNQTFKGKPFYGRWQRVTKFFGYSEYLTIARNEFKSTQQEVA
jgi:hypothetical protein